MINGVFLQRLNYGNSRFVYQGIHFDLIRDVITIFATRIIMMTHYYCESKISESHPTAMRTPFYDPSEEDDVSWNHSLSSLVPLFNAYSYSIRVGIFSTGFPMDFLLSFMHVMKKREWGC